MDPERELKHLENLKRVIATFERARTDLMNRRGGAIDSVMAILDDRLGVNARTLDALRRALDSAERELQRSQQTRV